MNRFADLFERHRPWVGALAATLSLVAVLGAARSRVDDVPQSIFRSDDEHYARLERVFRDFGTDDSDCLVVIEGEDPLGREGVALLRALEEELSRVDGVARVWSPDDLVTFAVGGPTPRPLLPAADAPEEAYEEAAAEARAHPLAGGVLVAPDGEVVVLVARLSGHELPVSVLEERVRALQAGIERVAAESRFDVRLTGVPPLRVVIFDAITREQLVFPPLAALVGLLIGLVVFRRPGPVLITLVASGLAGLWALGLMGWVDQPINLLTAQLPLLVMVIAYTDAIHLMIDTLRARRAGLGPIRAAGRSIRDLGLPCALTSLTTAIGFGSLAVSRVEVIQRFGTVFAAAVAMSFVVVLTAVPLGTSLFLGKSRRPSLARRYRGLHRPTEALIRAVLRRPRAVAGAGVAVTLVGLGLALRMVPENRLTEATPAGHPAVEALETLEEHFGGVLATSVLVEWPAERRWDAPENLAVLEAVTRVLEESAFTHAPRSVLDLLEVLPAPLANPAGLSVLPAELVQRFLRPDLHRALVTARVPDAGSAVTEPAYAALEERLEELRAAHPDVELNLTGTGYVARRNVNIIIRDFALGLGLAAVVILLVLGVAFRSLRLGAVSLLPNAFPVVMTGALLSLTGLELQVSSVLAFTVLLGIAVDDTIHFVSRYLRERAGGYGVDEALVRAFLGVGRALAITTVALGGGFGVTLFSVLPTSRVFALIVVLGLVAALVGDLLLLPAAVKAWGGAGRRG